MKWPVKLKGGYLVGLACAVGLLWALISPKDGDYPEGSLALGNDGCLYGTTSVGGLYDHGTVYRITTTGKLQTLHSFNGRDGNRPVDLIGGVDGSVYGVTDGGEPAIHGDGAVFKLTKSGQLSTIEVVDGSDYPTSLVTAADGSLYWTSGSWGQAGSAIFGVSSSGSFIEVQSDGRFGYLAGQNGRPTRFQIGSTYSLTHSACEFSKGDVVFKISGGYGYTKIHDVEIDSGSPTIVRSTDGNLFRIPQDTLLKVTQAGSILSEHQYPGLGRVTCLIQGWDGNLYGAVEAYVVEHPQSPANPAPGSTIYVTYQTIPGKIFRLSKSGILTTLYTFNTDNENWPTGLIQARDGNLYGTTRKGGAYGHGSVFKLSPSGGFTILHSFRQPMNPFVDYDNIWL